MFSFSDLDLSGIDMQTPGGSRIPPGHHVVRTSEAKLRDTRTGGKQVEVKLTDTEGRSSMAFINVHVPSSADATRIGRGELLALCTHGGHPNPSKPGDINTLNNLTVGVYMMRSSYMKDGKKRVGTEVAGFLPVEEAREKSKNNPDPIESMRVSDADGGGQKYDPKLDDEIPF